MSGRDDDRGTRVYVGGLSDSVKKEDLEGEFEKFGKLNSVWVAFNPPGFAFIEFNSQSDAETACDNLNGTDFLGSKLRVEIARGRSRRGGGGFRGGRGGGGGDFRRGGGGFRDSRGGGFRGGRGGGRGRGRFEDYGGRKSDGGRFSNDYGRNDRDGGFRRGGRDSFGRGRGGGGRRYDGDRFRSRSPVGGPRH